MKVKYFFYLLLLFIGLNLSAQEWECATEEEPNQNQACNVTYGCTYNSNTWLNEYRTPEYWIPDENTPIKTILINLVICQDDNGENAWQDTPEFRAEVNQLFNLLNETYSNIPEKGYWLTCEPSIDYITDSRIRFELNKIIFIQNTAFNQTAWFPSNVQNYLKTNYPEDYRKAMSHIFTGVFPSGGWGYYTTYDQGHYVHTRDEMHGDGPLYEIYEGGLVGHFAHEYGHAVGQHHTYNSEYTTISHYDFLDDVFGLCAEPEYCDPPVPNPTEKICYLKPDFFEHGNDGGPFPYPWPLMCGRDFHYISPKSAGRMHRALSHFNYTFKVYNRYMHKYVKEKYSYAVPKYISHDETWDFTIKMYQDIVVQSGNTLTVKCEILMPIDGRIIVEPGAKLIVEGGIIKDAHNEIWQGIQVLGNKNLAQTEANQGLVEVINGGTIENAEYGIYAGNPDNVVDNETGGIIRVENAVFINNRVAIYIPSYTESENQSYIYNSSFTTTPEYYALENNNTSVRPFIELWDTGSIDIQGNTFENTCVMGVEAPVHKQGVGIHVVDADMTVIPFGENPNEFINLYKGIAVEDTADNAVIDINNNVFTSCVIGLHMNNANHVSFTENQIDLYNDTHLGDPHKPTGLYITQSQGFHIEANEIADSSTTTPNETVGIYVRDCSSENQFYRNFFTNLDIGVFAEGSNIGPSITEYGLRILCNEFDEVDHDIYVAPVSWIAFD